MIHSFEIAFLFLSFQRLRLEREQIRQILLDLEPQADHPLLVEKEKSPSLVLTAGVKYSSRKIALKTARDGEKTWHMTQLTFSSNFYWNICFKFCILEQIIATVLFLCISSINNKRSSLRFQSTTAPTNRGWSACVGTIDLWHKFHIRKSGFKASGKRFSGR